MTKRLIFFFHERLASIQYDAAFAITSAISSRGKLYQELGFESLHQRKKQSSKYLSESIPAARQAAITRHKNSIPHFNVRPDYMKNSFLPSIISEWNNLDSNIRNYESLALFKKCILAFIWDATSLL